MKKTSPLGFTIIEITIVLIVIGIIWLITLNRDRGQIDDMRAMNERENWLNWHKKQTTTATNTNYITSGSSRYKSESITFMYSNSGSNLIISLTGSSGWVSQLIDSFLFTHYQLSGNSIQIQKKTLWLWCTISPANTKHITLKSINNRKDFTFTLNNKLCTRELEKK